MHSSTDRRKPVSPEHWDILWKGLLTFMTTHGHATRLVKPEKNGVVIVPRDQASSVALTDWFARQSIDETSFKLWPYTERSHFKVRIQIRSCIKDDWKELLADFFLRNGLDSDDHLGGEPTLVEHPCSKGKAKYREIILLCDSHLLQQIVEKVETSDDVEAFAAMWYMLECRFKMSEAKKYLAKDNAVQDNEMDTTDDL
jgi:hypothetical protein